MDNAIQLANPVFLAVKVFIHHALISDSNCTEPPRVTERITFSMIKAATSSVYIINYACAASFTPQALLGFAKDI